MSGEPTQQGRAIARKIGLLVIACGFLAGLAFIFLPAFTARSRPWFTSDMNNLQSIAIAMQACAIENDDGLPSHVALLKDEAALGSWEFVSRHDPRDQTNPVVAHPTPDVSYEYGSYTFLPTHGLELGDIADPSSFVIGYCPPYGTGFQGRDYPTAFLDGHAELLSEEELFGYINAQQQALTMQSPE